MRISILRMAFDVCLYSLWMHWVQLTHCLLAVLNQQTASSCATITGIKGCLSTWSQCIIQPNQRCTASRSVRETAFKSMPSENAGQAYGLAGFVLSRTFEICLFSPWMHSVQKTHCLLAGYTNKQIYNNTGTTICLLCGLYCVVIRTNDCITGGNHIRKTQALNFMNWSGFRHASFGHKSRNEHGVAWCDVMWVDIR